MDRLLLTAFLATLILDMGAGPVFIVFGSMNLVKSAPFPAAAWLLVENLRIFSLIRSEVF